MTKRFVPPPNWPSPPPGWRPPAGWRPDPQWGPAPRDWSFWQEEPGRRRWFARHKIATAVLAAPLALVVGLFGVAVIGAAATDSPATFAKPAGTGQMTPTAGPTPTPVTSADTASAAPSDSARASASASVQAEAKRAAKRAAESRAAKKEAAEEAAKKKAAKERAAEEREADNCTPGYEPCLPPASDYDCSGGTGNGPEYVDGPVRVTGSDPYDLDRDGNGIGCES